MIWGIKNVTTGVMMVGDSIVGIIKQAKEWKAEGHRIISLPSQTAKRMFNI